MFLAMTEEEICSTSPLPDSIAFLGCHFSPTTHQLSGLPTALPPDCGIILDDRCAIPDADTDQIAAQLSALKPAFILMDFQRPPTEASAKLAAALTKLDCPIPMPPAYGKDLPCPLFLPPVPPHIPIAEYLKKWTNREIWLELALDAVQITITPQGSEIAPFPHARPAEKPHNDSMLHCHYKITQRTDALTFYCYRTKEDICTMLQSPLPPNVTHTIGLFQELWDISCDKLLFTVRTVRRAGS